MRRRLQSQASVLRNRKRKIARGSTIAILSASVFGLLVWLSHANILQIDEVVVRGQEVVTEESILSTAEEVLGGNYLFLFSKRNKLIYPKSQLRKTLLDNFTAIRSVDISREKNRVLKIGIEERKPTYVWCRDGSSVADENCFYVDGSGYIYSKSPSFSKGVYIELLGGDGEGLGGGYMSLREMIFLQEMIAGLSTMKLKPNSVLVSERSVNNRKVELNFSKTKIIWNIDDDVSELLAKLSLLRVGNGEYLTIEDESVEYIDLRYGNNIFYKPTI